VDDLGADVDGFGGQGGRPRFIIDQRYMMFMISKYLALDIFLESKKKIQL